MTVNDGISASIAQPWVSIRLASKALLGAMIIIYAALIAATGSFAAGGWCVGFAAVAVSAIVLYFISEAPSATLRFWTRTRTTVIAVMWTALVVLAVILGAVRVSTWVDSDHFDGTLAGSCASSDRVVDTGRILDSRGKTLVGTFELVYSTSCRTAWIHASPTSALRSSNPSVVKTISREKQFLIFGHPEVTSDQAQASYGAQVYAPKCVQAEVQLKVGKKIIGSSRVLHDCLS